VTIEKHLQIWLGLGDMKCRSFKVRCARFGLLGVGTKGVERGEGSKDGCEYTGRGQGIFVWGEGYKRGGETGCYSQMGGRCKRGRESRGSHLGVGGERLKRGMGIGVGRSAGGTEWMPA